MQISKQIGLIAPPGTTLPFAGTTAPEGWLLCDGSEVSRTTYAELFAAIGETWGNGDGSTTFDLPDVRGRCAVGKDDMGGVAANRMTSGGSGVDGVTVGAAGGAETHSLSTAQLAAHTHNILGNNDIVDNSRPTLTGPTEAWTEATQNAGSGNAHQNTQPSAIFNYIIKY